MDVLAHKKKKNLNLLMMDQEKDHMNVSNVVVMLILLSIYTKI